jgi:hypothetical protein
MVDGFFNKSLSRRKKTTLFCSIWFIPTIWNTLIFVVVFSTFSFKDLLVEFLSLTVKVRLLEWYLMLQSRKLPEDYTAWCSWIHEILSEDGRFDNETNCNFDNPDCVWCFDLRIGRWSSKVYAGSGLIFSSCRPLGWTLIESPGSVRRTKKVGTQKMPENHDKLR